ncbi:MAG: hypothetical protein E6G56_12730 [Actinobacteria bacterium]|nr:MAG: hypothetical protein E6G56_12730 [Actinomycetota bacterium]
MSVIVTFRVQGDPKRLEELASADPDRLPAISAKAKEHGAIAHRFYGTDGQVMVIDEWPDAQSFQAFFEQCRPEIEPIMQEVGVGSEPEVNFWRKLETGDDVGWEA